MTFLEIQQDIADTLGITHQDDLARLGRRINRKYRQITASIGLDVTRRLADRTKAVTIGSQTVVISVVEPAGLEKILNLRDPNGKVLTQISYEEMVAIIAPDSDSVKRYAIYRMGADSVTIKIDVKPLTTFNLTYDCYDVLAPISGSTEPEFTESYHDILIWGVLAEEYRKLEKLTLAADADVMFERRLSDLRLWTATSAYLDIYPAKLNQKVKLS